MRRFAGGDDLDRDRLDSDWALRSCKSEPGAMCLGEVPYHLCEKVEIHDQRRFSTGVSKMQ